MIRRGSMRHKRKRSTVNINTDVKNAIKQYCARENISIQDFINNVLEAELVKVKVEV